MMIDFALDAERMEGKAPLDAIFQACLLRFRPILMTTMAACLAPCRWPWRRHRGGVAQSAGDHHDRRAHCQPDAHPVYHTGDLPRL